jgi:hypothetical protein
MSPGPIRAPPTVVENKVEFVLYATYKTKGDPTIGWWLVANVAIKVRFEKTTTLSEFTVLFLAHYSCLNGEDMMLRMYPDNTWQCPHCKTCVVCFETSDAVSILAFSIPDLLCVSNMTHYEDAIYG